MQVPGPGSTEGWDLPSASDGRRSSEIPRANLKGKTRLDRKKQQIDKTQWDLLFYLFGFFAGCYKLISPTII